MYLLVFLWIPSYFNGNFGVDMRQSALLSLAPWTCAIVASVGAGIAADALHNRGLLQLTNVRKLMQGIGSFGPAGCLFYLAWLNKVRHDTGRRSCWTSCCFTAMNACVCLSGAVHCNRDCISSMLFCCVHDLEPPLVPQGWKSCRFRPYLLPALCFTHFVSAGSNTQYGLST